MLYQAGGDRRARMRVFTSPSELEAAVGAELGVSGWFTVGQDRIDAFAEETGDRQLIHVDVVRSRREAPHRATVAHGYLTLSMLPAFIYDVIRLDGVRRSVNYGSNRGRFPAPVPRGARLARRALPAPGAGRLAPARPHPPSRRGAARGRRRARHLGDHCRARRRRPPRLRRRDARGALLVTRPTSPRGDLCETAWVRLREMIGARLG